MQPNSNEPIVTFSVPMSPTDIHSWILEKAEALHKLESLNASYAEIKSKLEKLEDDIFEQTEICNSGLGVNVAS
ncbi:MAG: hypothetical protein ACTH5W_18770 [Providencia sp.]|uniref:hypothetical protein n=1 Tax=Providencia sp. TaxID=589 RepID=UPI003F9E1314